jgi:methionyl-tRNA formyltransferase
MDLTYAYIGSTRDAKEILERSSLDPELIISFADEKEDKISGFTRYEAYDDRWLQVETINGSHAKEALKSAEPDIVFVVAWQEIIEPEVLEIASEGFVGRHLSLLPKRRGRAPVAWALIHGLDTTGTTLFWLDDGVDGGPIVDQTEVQIDNDDEASDLLDKHATATVTLLDNAKSTFESGEFPRTPQDDSEATYTHPRRPDMGLVDWTNSASRIYDFIRGQTHPYPGAFTYYKMDKVYLWHARVRDRTSISGRPGEVLESLGESTYRVQAGEGTLEIEVENVHQEHSIETGNVLGGHTPKGGIV